MHRFTLVCCSSRSKKFSSKKYLLCIASSKRSSTRLNPWMVPLLSVWEVKACFSLVNWHLIQGREEVTLPCCCEGPTSAFKLLPTVSYSFRQALWNDVSYSCGFKGFAYFYCLLWSGIFWITWGGNFGKKEKIFQLLRQLSCRQRNQLPQLVFSFWPFVINKGLIARHRM